MIYIETNSNDLAYNLALEYYFAAEKPMPDTVFLFWPTEPTLIVGRFQNVLEEVNMKTFKEIIVRHIMGGGDFFSSVDADRIADALIGCRYERGAVLDALCSHGLDGAVYRISASEMAETIAD